MTDNPNRPDRNTWALLATVSALGGAVGTYSIIATAGIFANAQTASLMAMFIGPPQTAWMRLVALAVFAVGISLTVLLPRALGRSRWRAVCPCLIGVAMLGQWALGAASVLHLLPTFWAMSLQLGTFDRWNGVPSSTVFSTNNTRQLVVGFWEYIRTREPIYALRMWVYGTAVGAFLVGTAICAALYPLAGRAVLIYIACAYLLLSAALGVVTLRGKKGAKQ